MTLLALALSLSPATLTLRAETGNDAGEPHDEAAPSPLLRSLSEGVWLIEGDERGVLVKRIVPSTTGDSRIMGLGLSWLTTCLAQPAVSGGDPCRVGKTISRMPACREPGDCLAYEAWTRFYGEPSLQPARPDPREGRPEDDPERRE